MTPLLRILAIWRARAPWLLLGVVVSLASVASAVALLTLSGAWIGSVVAGTPLDGPGLVAPALDNPVLGDAGRALAATGTLGAGLALAFTGAALLRSVGVARVVLRYAERLLTHEATFRALADLRVWFFRGLAVRSAGGLGFRRAGDVLSRLVGDVEALDGLYLRILVPACAAVLLLPILAVLFGRRDPALALEVCACFALAAFALPVAAARMSASSGIRLAETASALRVASLDTLSGLREVRAFGAEDRSLALVQSREAALLAAQRDIARRGSYAAALAFLCGQAALFCVLLAAWRHPLYAVPGAFLVVAAFEVAGGLSRAGVLAGAASAAAARVLDAAEGPLAVPEPAAPQPLPPGSALRFDAVSFRYAPDRPPVLDALTLDIPQGSRVAVLGPSGAGKSTLAALALRVCVPDSGRVTLGGTDTADLPAAAVRSRLSWLGQTTHLFADTIRANLLLARPAATDAELWDALDQAEIGATVRALPGGLDAWLGEGGAGLSGGQGRRVALARALLSPAPVLILDEPCAGLDSQTERAFLATLNVVAPGRSVLLITHRLTGVERLDRIYRLSSGVAVAAAA